MTLALLAVAASLAGFTAGAADGAAPAAAEARDMELVGHHDLQGRSAYQPTLHARGERVLAYVGHHAGAAPNPLTGKTEPNGTSILDVTDPARPVYLAHVPGPGAGGAQMVRVCDGATLPHGARDRVYMLRTEGNGGHAVWDVTDPRAPYLLKTVESGLSHTHKSWWDCESGIAYLVSDGRPRGWRSHRIMAVHDLSNPARPRFVRAFGLPGQEPGATGPVPAGLHGPIALGKRVYLAYGTGSDGVIQILDRERLLEGPPGGRGDRFAPTRANLLYPQVGRLDMPSFWGAHTTFPVVGMRLEELSRHGSGATRDFLLTVSEENYQGCSGPPQMAWLVDITDEARPFPVSTLRVPDPDGRFCARGGRFGPHASNESFAPRFYRKLVFLSWFSAGVRVFDIRDPFDPREVAWFIPPRPDGGVIQTNNVEVDERGYVYAVDRAGAGLHVLRLTGRAAEIVRE
jgi:hypothetical protein